MTTSKYKIEQFNNGTLFAVILDCGDGTTELCSSYYKTEGAAKKHMAKCRFWSGETETIETIK